MSILRSIGRAAIAGSKVQALASVLMISYSCFGSDRVQKDRLENAAYTSLSSVNHSRQLWSWGGKAHNFVELSDDEKACVECMTRVLSMDYSNQNLSRFAKNVLFNDTLICFDGISEMKDAWKFLWVFFRSSEAIATEVKRDVDTEGGVVLHIKYETEATTALGLVTGTFKSHVTLILENEQQRGVLSSPTFSGRAPPRIRAVEHRWFGGPILSRMTATQENVVGDFGDLCRRINGFGMSLILTARTEDGTRPHMTTNTPNRPPPLPVEK